MKPTCKHMYVTWAHFTGCYGKQQFSTIHFTGKTNIINMFLAKIGIIKYIPIDSFAIFLKM